MRESKSDVGSKLEVLTVFDVLKLPKSNLNRRHGIGPAWNYLGLSSTEQSGREQRASLKLTGDNRRRWLGGTGNHEQLSSPAGEGNPADAPWVSFGW